ncbi:YeeE/YedE family protein [Methylobacterium flocculans]|uniref:YeeE/YedE family protein n=1 Tax=Methylobacterium flocculans TaxID=2984843 RepID=UPI0021F32B8C|nr:YeeE/YedE family protein [Methylobacterium sp. FF17]
MCSLLGGLHRGWGATSGLGCSFGTLLSGIMGGAVSGWVFEAAMFAGLTATLLTGRRLVLLPKSPTHENARPRGRAFPLGRDHAEAWIRRSAPSRARRARPDPWRRSRRRAGRTGPWRRRA